MDEQNLTQAEISEEGADMVKSFEKWWTEQQVTLPDYVKDIARRAWREASAPESLKFTLPPHLVLVVGGIRDSALKYIQDIVSKGDEACYTVSPGGLSYTDVCTGVKYMAFNGEADWQSDALRGLRPDEVVLLNCHLIAPEVMETLRGCADGHTTWTVVGYTA